MLNSQRHGSLLHQGLISLIKTTEYYSDVSFEDFYIKKNKDHLILGFFRFFGQAYFSQCLRREYWFFTTNRHAS